MSIEICSKWVKDCEVVEVFSIDAFKYNHIGVIGTISDIVIFGSSCKISDAKILTKRDFLEQYKPYEPVYEYLYVLDYEYLGISEKYYKDDTEFQTKNEMCKSFQRIDFTKRVYT